MIAGNTKADAPEPEDSIFQSGDVGSTVIFFFSLLEDDVWWLSTLAGV